MSAREGKCSVERGGFLAGTAACLATRAPPPSVKVEAVKGTPVVTSATCDADAIYGSERKLLIEILTNVQLPLNRPLATLLLRTPWFYIYSDRLKTEDGTEKKKEETYGGVQFTLCARANLQQRASVGPTTNDELKIY
ncbi:unnamed protein product [Chrysodeixis includens]|uniref:Uncharacterized protein n=1 Tax=Chrysodeixis includens TaxID=689277 RepID=A0A9N8KXA3_CHRIL|nr:unnamed protein product [Chrysodeixis includens]